MNRSIGLIMAGASLFSASCMSSTEEETLRNDQTRAAQQQKQIFDREDRDQQRAAEDRAARESQRK